MILNKPSPKFTYILGLGLVLISGCASFTPTEENIPLPGPGSTGDGSSISQLEIVSPWTGGGNRDALEALVEVYQRQNPGVEVINPVNSGLSHPEVVALFFERLEKQQPFDSWPVHPGDEVRNHVILGQVEPLTQLFKDQGLDQVMHPVLIEQMPKTRFIVLGDAETDYSRFANVESLGYVEDLARTIGRSTALVRPTCHDGMPRLVLEMLSHGRHAITSQAYPHCHHAVGVEEIRRVLRRIELHGQFNLDGRQYVCQHFETTRTAELLRERLSRQLQANRSVRRIKGKWQAMQLLSRCPWLTSKKVEPYPSWEDLPGDAEALRMMLDPNAVAASSVIPA